METIKAIKQAIKAVPKGKQTALQFVRFCSASELLRAYVYGTDGDNFIVAFVDEDLPEALVPVDTLKPVVKGQEVKIRGLGYGVVECQTEIGTTKLQSENYDEFPVCPPLVEMTRPINVKEISQVVHAAGTEKYEPQLSVLHFTAEYVEAFSGSRFARVAMINGWTGLVSVKLFKAWPKGQTVTGTDGVHAFFKVGDEVRIGLLHGQFYPDMKGGIPVEFLGNRIVVDTKSLKSAIASSMTVGKANWVRFVLDDGLRVHPFGVENRKGKEVLCSYENAYSASIRVEYCFQPTVKPCTLNLNGRYVQEALKQVKTHNVILGYGDDGDSYHPLRIESAGFTACVWQLVL